MDNQSLGTSREDSIIVPTTIADLNPNVAGVAGALSLSDVVGYAEDGPGRGWPLLDELEGHWGGEHPSNYQELMDAFVASDVYLTNESALLSSGGYFCELFADRLTALRQMGCPSAP